MKTIHLSRPQEQINSTFSYTICIDGKPVRELKNGETIKLEIDENAELLTTKLMWCGSQAISLSDIEDGATVQVKANTLLNRVLPFLTIALLFIGILFSDGALMKIIMTSMIGLSILLLIGTLTIGRNNWLQTEPI